MVGTVVPLRSSTMAVTYYERDGYYARNDPEHRQASFWFGDAAQALGLKAHVCCSARTLDADRRGNVLIPFDVGGPNDDA